MADAAQPVRPLEEALLSPKEDVRYEAVRTLAGRANGAAMPLLLRALADESWRVRKEAVEVLAALPDREAVIPALIEGMGHALQSVRAAAAETLVLMGRIATPALVRALSSGTPEVRRRAALVLGDLKEASAVPSLAAALVDTDRRVRVAAAEALESLGTEGAVQAMLVAAGAMDDVATRLLCLNGLAALGRSPPARLLVEAVRHAPLRRVALRLLAGCDEPAAMPVCLDALADRARANREAALVCLESLRAHGLSPEELERARDLLSADDFQVIREALRSADPGPRTAAAALAGWLGVASLAIDVARSMRLGPNRDAAVAALDAMGSAGIEALWQGAADGAPSDREAAIAALAALSPVTALPVCRQALTDPHPLVAAAAARSLAQIGDAKDMPGLLAAMERGTKPLIAAAIDALRALGAREPAALGALLAAHSFGLRDDVDAALCEVARTLGAAATPILRAAAERGGLRTRVAAAAALAVAGGSAEAFDLLLRLVEDERGEVRAAALGALAKAAPGLDASAQERVRPVVTGALDDPDPRVRVAAVSTLGAFGPTAAFPKLVQLADAPDAGLALAAVNAARGLAGAAHVADRLAVFEHGLRHEDPEVVRAAVAGLADIEDAAAVAPLRAALVHPRFEVRLSAVRALAARGGATLEALRERLAEEDDPLVRESLRRALRGGE
jgi:HEAT repeat protein